MEISLTRRMAKSLMFKEEMINYKLMLDCTESTTRSISNLILFTLMKCQTHQEKENSMKIGIYMLRDLSMSNLDYQEEDILISLEETWLSRHQLRPEKPNFGGLIKKPKLSRIGITRDGHGIFRVLENKPTCKLGTLILDGGNSLDTKTTLLLMLRTTRFLMLQEEEIKKVTTFKHTGRTGQLLRNGLLFIKIKLEDPNQEA
jgi:hypothetical protein